MVRTGVESSHIKSMGYDPKTKTMEIEYKDGVIWQYRPVMPPLFKQAMEAESKGKWVNANIRGNVVINAIKVEGEPKK